MSDIPDIHARLITQRDIQQGAVTQVKLRQKPVRVTFTTADAPVVAYHGLGRIPMGYSVVSAGKGNGTTYIAPGQVYNDIPLPCDSRTIVLKCSVSGTICDVLVR